MYSVTYIKNGEHKVTHWETERQANSYAMYLWEVSGVYGVEIIKP